MSIALIGLGNILLMDEGIGVHAVKKLKEDWVFYPDIEIIDGGTLGLDLLTYFEKHSKILIIDAADFGKEPGYIQVLGGSDIFKSFSKKLSVHHIGLVDILVACELMGIELAEIKIIGIQPCAMDFGIQMTDEISKRMPDLIQLAIKNLQEWGIECVSQSLQK